MPVLVSRVEDLDDGQMATIKSIWETIKQLAPRSARKTYNAYTDDDFTEFVTSIFQDDWNTSRRPIQAARKPKKQDMNAITVGVWNKDVVKKADGATTIPAGKRKGAEALCRPEVVGDTVVFKIVDKHGAMHTFKDVTWDNGDRLTGEAKARVCMHYDRNEFSHVMAFNLQAARTHIQQYLWTPNDRMAVRAADPLPEFKEMNLCLPLWRSMYQDARVVRKEMKKMPQRRNFPNFESKDVAQNAHRDSDWGDMGGDSRDMYLRNALWSKTHEPRRLFGGGYYKILASQFS